MDFITKVFKDLSVRELFEIYKLRSEVFVVEQNCAYQDVDDKDLDSLHTLFLDNDCLIAYARIIPPSIKDKDVHIGRVVVNKDFRSKKFGQKLMNHNINKCLEMFKNEEIIISAQCYLIRFYNELGFEIEGQEYLEDNIPHIKMRYLKPSQNN